MLSNMFHRVLWSNFQTTIKNLGVWLGSGLIQMKPLNKGTGVLWSQSLENSGHFDNITHAFES